MLPAAIHQCCARSIRNMSADEHIINAVLHVCCCVLQSCWHDWGYHHLMPCKHPDTDFRLPLPSGLTPPPQEACGTLCFSAVAGEQAWGFCWPACVAAMLADDVWAALGKSAPLTTNFTAEQRQQVRACSRLHCSPGSITTYQCMYVGHSSMAGLRTSCRVLSCATLIPAGMMCSHSCCLRHSHLQPVVHSVGARHCLHTGDDGCSPIPGR